MVIWIEVGGDACTENNNDKDNVERGRDRRQHLPNRGGAIGLRRFSKILNIIQDAKAMDQKRNIRNYGRNFEFQGMKEALKPVLPNDRRPTKAKRLDCMWTNVTAAKQVEFS